jgi:hypothetical protein
MKRDSFTGYFAKNLKIQQTAAEYDNVPARALMESAPRKILQLQTQKAS